MVRVWVVIATTRACLVHNKATGSRSPPSLVFLHFIDFDRNSRCRLRLEVDVGSRQLRNIHARQLDHI
jgi:hypothetical protein